MALRDAENARSAGCGRSADGDSPAEPAGGGVQRRSVLVAGVSAGAAGAVGAAVTRAAPAHAAPPQDGPEREPRPTETVTVALTVNGRTRDLELDVRASLLDTLRDRIGLTGTKKGCDQGACGACTVLVDGRRTLSCLTLAVRCEGREVTTIEGLARDGELHPMQRAFVAQDGFQCGFCTSGQIMSAVALLAEDPGVPAAQVPELMSGNLCRCAAYPHIADAIAQARKEM
ncbi:(2Fe-2S)-binding protein [Streptomyces poriticola]|uniref:(2Fe-2S)-binding protein n=1 Tax=Streptomyces poriticola TaxID=3120506 RepID=UPI0038CD4592